MNTPRIVSFTLLTAWIGLCFACGSEPAADRVEHAASTEGPADAEASASSADVAIPRQTLFSEPDSEEVVFDAAPKANQAPSFVALAVVPTGAIRTGDDITAMPTAEDPDGDPVTFRYRWKVNGRPVRVDAATLSATHFERGDRIELTVEADDGEDTSFPMSIDPIVIANSVPSINSAPGPLDPDGTFRYTVGVEDPDSDHRFKYELRDPPDGMRIDSVEGSIVWMPRPDQAGVHQVTVAIDDRHDGLATQSFDLTIEFQDAPPPPAAVR